MAADKRDKREGLNAREPGPESVLSYSVPVQRRKSRPGEYQNDGRQHEIE